MTAPTTRETADHAKLAVENEDCETCDGAGEVEARIGLGTDYIPCPDCVSRDYKAEKAALLSEIAALRGELAKTERDYSELRDSFDAVSSKLCVERAHGSRQSVRATQAERRSDEAVGLLRLVDTQARVGHGGKPVMRSSRINLPATLWHQVRAFLANQGADQ